MQLKRWLSQNQQTRMRTFGDFHRGAEKCAAQNGRFYLPSLFVADLQQILHLTTMFRDNASTFEDPTSL